MVLTSVWKRASDSVYPLSVLSTAVTQCFDIFPLRTGGWDLVESIPDRFPFLSVTLLRFQQGTTTDKRSQ